MTKGASLVGAVIGRPHEAAAGNAEQPEPTDPKPSEAVPTYDDSDEDIPVTSTAYLDDTDEDLG